MVVKDRGRRMTAIGIHPHRSCAPVERPGRATAETKRSAAGRGIRRPRILPKPTIRRHSTLAHLPLREPYNLMSLTAWLPRPGREIASRDGPTPRARFGTALRMCHGRILGASGRTPIVPPTPYRRYRALPRGTRSGLLRSARCVTH